MESTPPIGTENTDLNTIKYITIIVQYNNNTILNQYYVKSDLWFKVQHNLNSNNSFCDSDKVIYYRSLFTISQEYYLQAN